MVSVSVHQDKWTLWGGILSKKRTRRVWSDDEKRLICEQTRAPGISVAQVARRYGLNANLLFKWLREPKFAEDVASEDDPVFLPVEIDAAPIADQPVSAVAHPGSGLCVQRIDLTLSDGRRVLVEGATELAGVLVLIKGLMP